MARLLYRRLLLRLGRDRVRDCDEYRTSVLDSISHTRMVHPPQMEMVCPRSGKTFTRVIFGVYQNCESGASRLWNRDVNAARNMVQNYRHLYEHGELPLNFRRGVDVADSAAAVYRYRPVPGRADHKFCRRRH